MIRTAQSVLAAALLAGCISPSLTAEQRRIAWIHECQALIPVKSDTALNDCVILKDHAHSVAEHQNRLAADAAARNAHNQMMRDLDRDLERSMDRHDDLLRDLSRSERDRDWGRYGNDWGNW